MSPSASAYNAHTDGVPNGPLVKWLRQRPLTPLTSVRIRYGSPQILYFPVDVCFYLTGKTAFSKKISHLAMANALPVSAGSRKVLDKRPAIAYDIVCSRNAVPIVGAD